MIAGVGLQDAPDLLKLGLWLFSMAAIVIFAALWLTTWQRLAALIAGIAIGLVIGIAYATARDDGRYAGSPLKPWFDSLTNKRGGQCCSDADGTAISDADWRSKDGHYEVFIEGNWYDVPEHAVITEPNRVGRTMVWPLRGPTGLSIQCFMPGPGA